MRRLIIALTFLLPALGCADLFPTKPAPGRCEEDKDCPSGLRCTKATGDPATDYRCVRCGQTFVMLRSAPVDVPGGDAPATPEEVVDISSQVTIYVKGDRRLPSRPEPKPMPPSLTSERSIIAPAPSAGPVAPRPARNSRRSPRASAVRGVRAPDHRVAVPRATGRCVAVRDDGSTRDTSV